jgi:hypothetical protein
MEFNEAQPPATLTKAEDRPACARRQAALAVVWLSTSTSHSRPQPAHRISTRSPTNTTTRAMNPGQHAAPWGRTSRPGTTPRTWARRATCSSLHGAARPALVAVQ